MIMTTSLNSGTAGHGGHFGREIIFLLLDALAQAVADETGHLHRRPEILRSLLKNLRNAAFTVDHEDLFAQDDFLVVLAQASLDHLGDDFLRLARFARLFGQYRALTLNLRPTVDSEYGRASKRDW